LQLPDAPLYCGQWLQEPANRPTLEIPLVGPGESADFTIQYSDHNGLPGMR
jgi:hypothetical protein